ncbi:hypothetical protein DYB31_013464 [Aphanomyces astaci]|uniref:Sulfhydryl oxidase n=1 Tax=Aphanomyces astaci TaxID=112090 RepID=A0A397F0X0_APHAT|nr:hypothetical protein DYB31_013464 [Aphanomyces astaci]
MLALLFAALVAAVASLADAKGRLDPTPLFKEDHPNVTYLTDHNYNQLIRDAPLDGKPWLIDFYHPYCPHCKQFVPVFTEIAAHYKPLNIINVGAMSCMDWEQCAVYKIKGFPTLGLWNFDNNMNFENKRAVGEHSRDEVFGLVAQLFREQVFNATGSWPVEATTSSPPGTTTLRPLWEESTLPSNATTRVLDAASAFVFGMRESVFTGRSTLEDIELDALKEWLRVVSLTFPGEAYRHLLANLYKQVAPVAVLTQAKWRVIFHGWQNHTAMMHKEYTKSIYDPEEWELLPTLFEGYGTTYYACELYTCGQWTMFHLMTMMVGPGASDELAMSVVTAIRRFVKNFLTCLPCRKHFLAYNTLELVERLDNEVNKPKAVYMWLWTMHNATDPNDASTSTAPVIGLHHKAEGQLFTPDLSFFALYLVPVAVFIVFVGLRRMRSAPRQGNHLRDV